MELGVTSVAAITVISYLLGQVVKITPLSNCFLPLICGVSGGLLGLLSYFLMPSFPAGDVITAIAVGIQSGLAATGAHQAVKQLKAESEKNGNQS